MTVTGLLGWLVVRQGLTRRTYNCMGQLMLWPVRPVSCLDSRSLRTSQGARRKQRWFQIRSMNDPEIMRVSSERIVREVSEDRRIASVIQ